MKIKLVFEDWKKNGKSIYNTEEGIELSIRNFHSGTIFDGKINLSPDDEKELKEAMKNKNFPSFYLICPDITKENE